MLCAKCHTQCAKCLCAMSFYVLHVCYVLLTVGVVASGTNGIRGQATTKAAA